MSSCLNIMMKRKRKKLKDELKKIMAELNEMKK
jgi:hypothetical protein